MLRLAPALTALLLAMLLGACASRGTQSADVTDPSDPLEPTNRRILAFNLRVDDCCIKPVAKAYRDNVPEWGRTRIRNVVHNIEEPTYVVNDLLQGRPVAAGTSFMRFVINSTLGLAGMFDLQPIGGPPRKPSDFGMTLYRWGASSGPYLMIPILGPSDVRDFGGTVVDGFVNPISWAMPFYGNIARGTVNGLDLRAQNIETLDALRADSLDFYARLRSVWQQQRDAELSQVKPGGGGENLDILQDPNAPNLTGRPR